MKEDYFQPKNIYYRISRNFPQKPTLVFVHGLSGSSSAWKKYEEKFEKQYNVLTFDLRGHGKSEKQRQLRDYEIRHFADDIHELVTHLNIKNFVSRNIFVYFNQL